MNFSTTDVLKALYGDDIMNSLVGGDGDEPLNDAHNDIVDEELQNEIMSEKLENVENSIDLNVSSVDKSSNEQLNEQTKRQVIDTTYIDDIRHVSVFETLDDESMKDRKRYANEIIDQSINKDVVESREIRTYKPKLTRKTMSVFEYVGAITKLAKYINSMKQLPDFNEEIEIKNMINPSEVAYILLKNGVYDPIFDRGYEKVSFSELDVNPIWAKTIESYFECQHESLSRELGIFSDFV